MKVWKVSTGEYSYYTVVAVFASKKLANRYVEAKGDRYRVEKGDKVVTALPDNPVPRLRLGTVVKEDGTTEDTEETTYYFPDFDDPWDDLGTDCYTRTDPYAWTLVVETRGHDLNKVRKVHSEARAQAIAEGPVIIAKKRAEREEQERRYLVGVPPHMRDSAIANMGSMIMPRIP